MYTGNIGKVYRETIWGRNREETTSEETRDHVKEKHREDWDRE